MSTDNRHFFADAYPALTGNTPFLWQGRLFRAFASSEMPPALDIPTGLGKTAIIPIWLLALAWQVRAGLPTLPRRLVYVVNRRTVVDQATDIAMRLRSALRDAAAGPAAMVRDALRGLCADPDDDASPLGISTLRGELADNMEWQTDPARPGIVIGTVDMIGSRLLFSGYGVSRRMRPFHAGLLGQDALLVHDEAHLEPAFGDLLRQIAAAQVKSGSPRPVHVLELSATQREMGSMPFTLTEEEAAEPEAARRLRARKRLRLAPRDPARDVAEMLATLALERDAHNKHVIVYVRSPRTARDVAARLVNATSPDRVALLTGTLRGHERNELAEGELLRRFRSDPARTSTENTVYLVATSAGEVGIDLDGDDMVSDLTTLDSMIQRLGRVNRLGRGLAIVDVLDLAATDPDEEADDYAARIRRTRDLIESLPMVDDRIDVGPLALRLLSGHSDAFVKQRRSIPITGILLDTWALTRVNYLPGRLPVERWLHGVGPEVPQLGVAWRIETADVVNADVATIEALFESHRLLSHEVVRGSLPDVVAELKKLVRRSAGATVPALFLGEGRHPVAGLLADLLEDEVGLREGTIVLPPEAGGLDTRGMLDGSHSERVLDVADGPSSTLGSSRPAAPTLGRARILLDREGESGLWSYRRLAGEVDDAWIDLEQSVLRRAVVLIRETDSFEAMAEKKLLILARDADGQPSRALLLLADRRSIETVESSTSAGRFSQRLDEHLEDVSRRAAQIVTRLGLSLPSPSLEGAIALAASLHDRGKNRVAWQKAIGNARKSGDSEWRPLAKSGKRGFDDGSCGRYRHEFGSLREAALDVALAVHAERDLVLHLIGAHHGWARPHFEPEQWDVADDVSDDENAEIAADAMRRFAQLQRRFGHWGLAWLESLLRAADYMASRASVAPAPAERGGR
jgi:CRISPR-associated endonuclease/helicase Cas3